MNRPPLVQLVRYGRSKGCAEEGSGPGLLPQLHRATHSKTDLTVVFWRAIAVRGATVPSQYFVHACSSRKAACLRRQRLVVEFADYGRRPWRSDSASCCRSISLWSTRVDRSLPYSIQCLRRRTTLEPTQATLLRPSLTASSPK
jgi:hypothetical protein